MATGDQNDFARRLRGMLPNGWFPAAPAIGATEQAPVLAGMLASLGSVLAGAWTLFEQVAQWARLATSSGSAIDAWADDYFGSGAFPRAFGETDTAYAARIKASLLAPKNTRAAISAAIQSVNGAPPTIIETMNAGDTHAYASTAAPAGGGGYGYGCAGLNYGSLNGGQFFVQATLENASQQQIEQAVNDTKAEGVIAWLQTPFPASPSADPYYPAYHTAPPPSS